ncbi:MAG: acylneuraminate cytidylyltransferase family protein, partial [Deltaproteobacteria bacterium]|nr:acylneuraminate cytidylyltransferase family protein [Deltaproteobacteria bacterium]
PLIAWTIEAALKSRRLSRVILSTDDDEIAQVGQAWGVEVPFRRPKRLAQDDSPHVEALVHALNWLKKHENYVPDYFAVLLPTAPLRQAEDIDAACDLVLAQKADTVLGVCESPIHPFFIKGLTKDGRLTNFVDVPKGYLRRQDLPQALANFGTINVTRTKKFLELKDWPSERVFPCHMPPERSLDVDSAWSLRLADLILTDQQKAST